MPWRSAREALPIIPGPYHHCLSHPAPIRPFSLSLCFALLSFIQTTSVCVFLIPYLTLFLSLSLSLSPPIYSIYLFIYIYTFLSLHLSKVSIYRSISIPFSLFPPIYSINLSVFLSLYLSLSTYLQYLCIYLSLPLHTYLQYLFIYLSTPPPPTYLSISHNSILPPSY